MVEIKRPARYTHPITLWWWTFIEHVAVRRVRHHQIELTTWTCERDKMRDNLRRALEENLSLVGKSRVE